MQTLTGRDCFAFLFMVLILAGLERIALSHLSRASATLWFLYVLIDAASALPRAFRGAA